MQSSLVYRAKLFKNKTSINIYDVKLFVAEGKLVEFIVTYGFQSAMYAREYLGLKL